MKSVSALLFVILFFASCSTRKTETSYQAKDSVTVDSTLATTPAPALLAFSPMDGYVASKTLELPDSVNYFLLGSGDDMEQRFTRTGDADASNTPDYIINYVIAVACKSSTRPATITIAKVVTGESTLDVHLIISRDEESKSKLRPAQVFAIERREGYPVMQFYVNGKKDKGLVLVEGQ